MSNLLAELIDRKHYVAIERGRLIIQPKSGEPVPMSWLAKNESKLTLAITKKLGLDAYQYSWFKPANYSGGGGDLLLTFERLLTGETLPAFFNVLLHNPKTKRPYKGKEFYAPPNGAFAKLWRLCGLPEPERQSRYFKRMGKLKPYLFTADTSQGKEKLIASSIKPLELTHEQLLNAFESPEIKAQTGHTLGTNRPRLGHKQGTTQGHIENAETIENKEIPPTSTTGVFSANNEQRLKNERITANVIPLSKPPQEQSNEEWLRDFDGTG